MTLWSINRTTILTPTIFLKTIYIAVHTFIQVSVSFEESTVTDDQIL